MPLWLAEQPLVLASKSAVRHAILRDAGIPVEIMPADIDERGIEQRAGTRDPGEVAALLGREKARALAARQPGRLVLGAASARAFSRPSKAATSPSRPILRPRASSSRRCVGGRTSCTPRS